MKTFEKIFAALFLFLLFTLTGCKNNSTGSEVVSPTTDNEAMKEIAAEDSSVLSFEMNYQESGDLNFLNKIESTVFPVKVKRIVTSITRNLTTNIIGDTAYGLMTHTFTGALWIYASIDSARWGDTTQVDTIIKKPFTTTVSRNLIFTRIGRTNRPKLNWKLQAVSLPEGGTSLQNNIRITKLTVTSSVDTFSVTDPLTFYLKRGIGWWRQYPVIPKNSSVNLRLEVFSTAQDTDFVTLTFGAVWPNGYHRAKKKFILLSSTPTTNGYLKVYEQNYSSYQYAGHFHAIIDAMPKAVIFDDTAPVESSMWAFPYIVKN